MTTALRLFFSFPLFDPCRLARQVKEFVG